MAESARLHNKMKKKKKFINMNHMKSKFNGVVQGSDSVID